MGRIVVCCFRPRPGKERELLGVIRDHMPTLRSQGLITDRKAVVMRAADGTIVEVFEWKSAEAVEQAHSNPVVRALWDRFERACEYGPLSNLAEAGQPFPHFDPVDV